MIFKKNIEIKAPLKMNMWRKITLSAWGKPNEPVIYTKIELRPEKAKAYLKKLNENQDTKITMTHFIGKVCGILLHKHEDINTTILFNKPYIRTGSDVFFQASFVDSHGKENLTGVKVKNCANKTIVEIANEMNKKVLKVKDGQDEMFNSIKSMMKWIPIPIVRIIIALSVFIQYRLNIWTPLLRTKKDSFGAMLVTNIGSLGVKEAYVPFPSYTNVVSILAFGNDFEAPVIENGELKVGLLQNACWSIDHRVIDGSNGSKMINTFRTYFENPELIDKFDLERV